MSPFSVAAIDARPTSSLQSVVIDGQLRPDSRWQSSLSVPCVHLTATIRAATLVAEPPISTTDLIIAEADFQRRGCGITRH